jgi:hypothetical protein
MTVPAVQPPGTGEPVFTDYKCYYNVEMAAGEDGCAHCGAGKMWAIVYVEHGQTEKTEIGQTFGDRELADDICDLMNMAYESGLELASAGEVTFAGKLIDVGNLDAGRGISLEIDGEQVDLTGLSEIETKQLVQWLYGQVTITIRSAASQLDAAKLRIRDLEQPAKPSDHQQSNVDFMAAVLKSYLGDCTDGDPRLAAAWWGWRAARGEIPARSDGASQL